MAIYKRADLFDLAYCDSDWNVDGLNVHFTSIEEARKCGERFYGVTY